LFFIRFSEVSNEHAVVLASLALADTEYLADGCFQPPNRQFSKEQAKYDLLKDLAPV
jgi:hypothetical protein